MKLSEQLIAASAELSERVMAEMFVDPFWQKKYGGERATKHTRADGDFHVKYLAEALESEDPRVFASYARWLRELLVSHGMCSRHLQENFNRLASAITDKGWPDHERAVAILHAGAQALVYRDGAEGHIDHLRLQAQPEGDLDTLLSYLADAVAFEQPARFAAYVEFARTLRTSLDVELAAVKRLIAGEARALEILEAA
ncbi:MAG: hypothetical protein QM831_33360 [Kofleriaceae bacterium]